MVGLAASSLARPRTSARVRRPVAPCPGVRRSNLAAQPDPANLPHPDPSIVGVEAATQAYLDTVPPEKRTRSDAYFEGGYWLILWRFLWSSLALLVLLHFRLSASLRDFAARLTRFGFLQPAIYWVGFALFTFLFALPLAVYADFVREHHYGLSTQSFGAWFTDALKVLGLDLVIGAMGAAVFYAALRRAGRRWWLWGSGIALVFVVLVAMIGPVYIAPLFNTYQPVGDPAIREPVLSLARANGIDAAQVWQMDASRQTTRISANVSGMLGTERITLNDNLLVRTSREGVLAVMGHEMALRAQSHLRAAGVVRAPDRHRLWRHRRGLSRSCQAPGPPLADPGSGRPGRTAAHRSALQRLLLPHHPAHQLDHPEQRVRGGRVRAERGETARGEILFFDHPSGYTRISSAMRWKANQPGDSAP